MGLLIGEKNETMTYEDSRKVQRLLKRNAALQLAMLLKKFEDFVKSDAERLKFGTELESHLLSRKTVEGEALFPVYLNSKPFMEQTKQAFKNLDAKEEFSAWMIELLPVEPFSHFLKLGEIRTHFREIQDLAIATSAEPLLVAGLSVLPHIGTLHYHLGAKDEVFPLAERAAQNRYSQSDSFLDSTITDHSRFRTLTQNTRTRHEGKPLIRIPVFADVNTKEKELVLDHFGFGMCNTALQVTYSCRDLTEARLAHDLMHVLSPFMLSFSSSVFAVGGKLVDWNARFRIIEQSTDDRKPAEQGKLVKTRYSTNNLFLSNDKKCKARYNDSKFTLNKAFQKQLHAQLKKQDSALARDRRLLNHFAYLFVRDFLIVFPERAVEGYCEDTNDFESLQSTNWHSMRLKPPGALDSNLGWLLEFRCMDSPITEREKSVLVFVATLFMRVVTDPFLDVDFYAPISVVDHNFDQAIKRDSLTSGRFLFRKHFCPLLPGYQPNNDELVELTMAEFWGGSADFAGMRGLFQMFVVVNAAKLAQESETTGEDVVGNIWQCFRFLLARAEGKIQSCSRYLREFVLKHADYKQDSNLSNKIVADVIEKVLEIQKNNYQAEMFGEFKF